MRYREICHRPLRRLMLVCPNSTTSDFSHADTVSNCSLVFSKTDDRTWDDVPHLLTSPSDPFLSVNPIVVVVVVVVVFDDFVIVVVVLVVVIVLVVVVVIVEVVVAVVEAVLVVVVLVVQVA